MHGRFFGSGVAEAESFELGDARVQILDHFAQPVAQSGVFVDEYLFGLVFEEVLNSGDKDLATAAVFLLNLRHVERETLEPTRRWVMVIKGDAV
jgi:hypothetical protein